MPQITAFPSAAAAFLPGAASSQMVPIIHPADQAALLAAVANGQVNGHQPGSATASGAATPVSQHAAVALVQQQQQQAAAAIAAAASQQHGKARSDRIEVRTRLGCQS